MSIGPASSIQALHVTCFAAKHDHCTRLGICETAAQRCFPCALICYAGFHPNSSQGLQWFIPYLIAIFILAIPTLILEVSIGQAYRGGTVVAFNNVHRRLKGVGLASMLVSATGEPLQCRTVLHDNVADRIPQWSSTS